MADTFSYDSLRKLTVPQLKALCKEARISGFSKLSKEPLILKVVEFKSCLKRTDGLTDGSSTSTSKQLQSDSQRNDVVPFGGSCATSIQQYNDNSTTGFGGVRRKAQNDNKNMPSSDKHLDSRLPSSPVALAPPEMSSEKQLHKRLVNSEARDSGLPSKKRRTAISAFDSNMASVSICEAPFYRRSGILPAIGAMFQQEKRHRSGGPDTRDSMSSFHVIKVPELPRTKRFVPLAANNKTMPKPLSDILSQGTSKITADRDCSSPAPVLTYLEFPAMKVPVLTLVSLPPSLSQRKQVPTLALSLCLISKEDLKSCAQVSRLFRYAAFISASYSLTRHFSGRRLQAIIKSNSSKTMNLWPYLLQRKEEVLSRKKAYNGSFLGQVLKVSAAISERLWTSPDNEKQITVTVRFLLTRFYFLVSVGCENRASCAWKNSTIVDAQEIIPGEVWSIMVQLPTSMEVFYVLESTCEVIGRTILSSDTPAHFTLQSDGQTPVHLRADWSSYISEHLKVSMTANGLREEDKVWMLTEYLKWTNHEEYKKGISKIWLRRIKEESEVGAMKITVAERYVYACVVSNSVSGRWMTSTEMAQEFNGLPEKIVSSKEKSPRINLFLPAHHHIESVHFTSSTGVALHPALAVVQTPGREYFILKDNGMQVGCEEDGVAEVWMQLLGCNAAGAQILL